MTKVKRLKTKNTRRKHTRRKHTRRKHTRRKHTRRKHTRRKHTRRKHTRKINTRRKNTKGGSPGAYGHGHFSDMTALSKLKPMLTYVSNWNGRLKYPTDGKDYKLFKWTEYNKILKDITTSYDHIVTNSAKPSLYSLKLILEADHKVIIIGDIHSSLYSLIQILEKLLSSDPPILRNDFSLTEGYYLVFLGDLVDRGPYSIEVLLIALILKIKNPDNVVILNGNHEDPGTYSGYGLDTEMDKELGNPGVDIGPTTTTVKGRMNYRTTVTVTANPTSSPSEGKAEAIGKIQWVLSRLPAVLFVKYKGDGKYFQLCHGGIDPEFNPEAAKHLESRQPGDEVGLSVPKYIEGLDYEKNGFKWTDFDYGTHIEPRLNPLHAYKKGMWIYGPEATREYLTMNNLHSIISGHQDTVNLALLRDIVFRVDPDRQSEAEGPDGDHILRTRYVRSEDADERARRQDVCEVGNPPIELKYEYLVDPNLPGSGLHIARNLSLKPQRQKPSITRFMREKHYGSGSASEPGTIAEEGLGIEPVEGRGAKASESSPITTLDPTSDFLALVTSTATGPKWSESYLTNTSYLMLGYVNGRPALDVFAYDLPGHPASSPPQGPTTEVGYVQANETWREAGISDRADRSDSADRSDRA